MTGQDVPYCDSCNHHYPHKDKPGHCGCCFVLEDTQQKEGEDSVKFQELLNRDHCQGCGAIGKYFRVIPAKGLNCISCFTKVLNLGLATLEQFVPQSPKGASNRHMLPPPTPPQHGPSVPGYPTDADKARAAAFTLKMQEAKNRWNSDGHAGNMQGSGSGSGGNGYSPSTILNTANLTGLRNVVNGKTELFIVYLTVNNGKKVSVSRLGPTSDSHHPDCLVPDLLEIFWLPKYNAIWMTSLPEPLLQSEVELRWKGNKLIEGNTHLGTLRELYAYHKALLNADQYIPRSASAKKQVLPSIHLELLINISAYQDHVHIKVPHELGSVKSRQVALGKNAPESQSVMIQQSKSSSAKTSSQVLLQIACLKINDSGSISKLSWPNQIFHGILMNNPMAKGLMKKVYELTMLTSDNGSRWVAKHFFNVGSGIEAIEIEENMVQLYEEVVAQKKGQYFLDRFYERAEETDVSISMKFRFTDCRLVREIISNDPTRPNPSASEEQTAQTSPSHASNLDDIDYQLEKASKPESIDVIWSIEPRCPSHRVKWNGTLQFDSHGHRGAGQIIMDAFTHFSYSYSNGDLVFADLQSTEVQTAEGKIENVLFDTAIHTSFSLTDDPDERQSISDHGQKGIDLFCRTHRCNQLCTDLQLPDLTTSNGNTIKDKMGQATAKGKRKRQRVLVTKVAHSAKRRREEDQSVQSTDGKDGSDMDLSSDEDNSHDGQKPNNN
ncbi:kinase-like domain-containing protein [Armillaria novae-zelandiae]|uniref:Kinase-like domain-containing protein n=1 Tax=Armillaria novae-zelandiae TaxID=153914 RepID=A0AA39NSJ9_9AGAR|nr:kinase-like domain-containing protein [Armillaria novae-zelandiae]